MSASLESLMRSPPEAAQRDGLWLGLLSFVGVGALASASFVVLSSALIWLGTGVPDWVISTACYAGMIVPVYLMHRRFSFRSEAPHAQALPRYVAVQALALVLAALFSYLAYGLLTLPTMAMSTLVIGLTAGVNFVVLRSWAFARRMPQAQAEAQALT